MKSLAPAPAPPPTAKADDPNILQDPLPPKLREGDHFLLHFADDRQLFAQALPRWRTAKGYPPCKINRRTYQTENLIGLPYGTVLEVGRYGLVPLPEGEGLLPEAWPAVADGLVHGAAGERQDDAAERDERDKGDGGNGVSINGEEGGRKNAAVTSNGNGNKGDGKTPSAAITRADNRDLVDDNTSQRLTHSHVHSLMSDASTPGSSIVAALVSGSSTFGEKTAFSQEKYVRRKQLKHQPRCRIVRVTPASLCSAMHLKDPRRVSNLREDTLGRVLSGANVCAGQRLLVVDDAVQGIITASCARRMGGYGSVISLYSGSNPVPGYIDVVNRMNFTVSERQCVKWVSLGEVFANHGAKAHQTKSLCDENGIPRDIERRDRESIQWPAPLQPHTRNYLLNELRDERKVSQFLARRSARFARKLTRHSMLELRELVDGCRDHEGSLDGSGIAKNANVDLKKGEEAVTIKAGKNGDHRSNNDDNGNGTTTPRQCDSLIVATKYDPTATLQRLLPYLAPSCPFVVYHEFLEPLLETFRTLQNHHMTGVDYGHQGDCGNAIDGEANIDHADGAGMSRQPPMMLRRNVAIDLRLTDTWFREYQVLDGRTHPTMTMSQNGGYVLMGTKLCPRTGTNELDEEDLREIRARVGGRRSRAKGTMKGSNGGGRKKKRKGNAGEKD